MRFTQNGSTQEYLMGERIWRCTCGWAHYLSIRSLDLTSERWLTVDGSFRVTNTREKIRACWEIFRRGHYDTWLEVQLDELATEELRDELTRMIND